MATDGGPDIIRDGLVFGYDTGYPIANNENALRFSKGEPVDNEFYNSGTAGNILDYSSGYGGYGTLQSNELDAFGTTDNAVYRNAGKIRFGPTGGQDIGTLIYGNTYTFSIYLKHVYGQTESGGMEFDICDRANSRSYSGTLGSNMTYDWKRFSVTALHNNSSNYHFLDLGTYQGTNVFDWCCPQIELSSHASPFTNTERSSTQSLIDLKRTTDIDVSNVSFDSTGQPEFDGTDDFISMEYNSTIDTPNGATYEILIYPQSSGEFLSRGVSDSGVDPDNPRFYIGGSGNLYFDWSVTGADTYVDTVVGTVTLNGWNHIVGVANPGEQLRVYVNGVEPNYGTVSRTLPIPLPNTTNPIIVGGVKWIPRYIQGKIPIVKLYNRTLTSDEIKQNYNAYKNRFDI